MKFKYLFIVLCILITVYQTSNAQNLIPLNFEESLRDDVPVSGTVLAGIALSEFIPKEKGLTLYTLAPKDSTWLCVTVKSIDGRYLSMSSYQSKLKTTQWIGLQFPSKYEQDIKEYGFNDIAIQVTSHQKQLDCQMKGKNLISNWSIPNKNINQNVSIMINSGRIKSSLRKVGSKQQPIECREINSSKLVTYDKVCSIPISDFKTGKWTIIRQRMGKRLPPYYFELFSHINASE